MCDSHCTALVFGRAFARHAVGKLRRRVRLDDRGWLELVHYPRRSEDSPGQLNLLDVSHHKEMRGIFRGLREVHLMGRNLLAARR